MTTREERIAYAKNLAERIKNGLKPQGYDEHEDQDIYVLSLCLEPVPCPHCDTPVNRMEAAIDQDRMWDLQCSVKDTDYECPHCSFPLVFCVPAMGVIGICSHWIWLKGDADVQHTAVR